MCDGWYHRFSWSSTTTGHDAPPGLYCNCGQYVTNLRGQPVAVAEDQAEKETPDGRCPRCKEPWDDHPRPKCPLRLEVPHAP